MAIGSENSDTSGDAAAEDAGEFQRRRNVHNEQTKLRANLLNTVAAGFVIAGIITPFVNATSGGIGVATTTGVLMAIWFVGAVILHRGAQLVLESLR